MIYRHTATETIIETCSAKTWDDFTIVTIDAPNLTAESFEQLQDIFSEYSKHMNKEVVLVPKGVDIEFYGVEVDEDDN